MRIDNLEKSYENKAIFSGISFELASGLIWVSGSSGSGKTTLLRCLSGLESSKGYISYFEGKSERERQKFLRDEICYLGDSGSLLDTLSLNGNIDLLAGRGASHSERYRKLCKRYEFEEERIQISKLSEQDRYVAAVIATLIQKRSIYLLDDPYSHLDENRGNLLRADIERLSKDHLVLVASRDCPSESVDARIDLDEGTCTVDNPGHQIATNANRVSKSFTPSILVAEAIRSPLHRLLSIILIFGAMILCLLGCAFSSYPSSTEFYSFLIEDDPYQRVAITSFKIKERLLEDDVDLIQVTDRASFMSSSKVPQGRFALAGEVERNALGDSIHLEDLIGQGQSFELKLDTSIEIPTDSSYHLKVLTSSYDGYPGACVYVLNPVDMLRMEFYGGSAACFPDAYPNTFVQFRYSAEDQEAKMYLFSSGDTSLEVSDETYEYSGKFVIDDSLPFGRILLPQASFTSADVWINYMLYRGFPVTVSASPDNLIHLSSDLYLYAALDQFGQVLLPEASMSEYLGTLDRNQAGDLGIDYMLEAKKEDVSSLIADGDFVYSYMDGPRYSDVSESIILYFSLAGALLLLAIAAIAAGIPSSFKRRQNRIAFYREHGRNPLAFKVSMCVISLVLTIVLSTAAIGCYLGWMIPYLDSQVVYLPLINPDYLPISWPISFISASPLALLILIPVLLVPLVAYLEPCLISRIKSRLSKISSRKK